MGIRRGLLPVLVWAPLVFAAPVDFAREVQPLLLARCGGCHSGATPQGGLAVHTRAELLRGGGSGPAIRPGDSGDSLLIQRVSGQKPPRMPMGGAPPSLAEVDLLRRWIDAGAGGSDQPPPAGFTPSLELLRPPVPSVTVRKSRNPIDHFLAAYFERKKIKPPEPVQDSVFLRRAYLDLWGLLPSPEQQDAFRGGRREREKLIETLLANQQNYAEHWISYWNDLLRNDEGVDYIGLRKSISPWLLGALEQNLPYNRFVNALLSPTTRQDPDGFLVGVNWRGDVSASQTPALQAAQNTAQVFLGINLKCNSCHDSFISRWKLKDAYGLAAFWSAEDLELVRCDVKTGQKAEVKFLYPELGAVPQDLCRAEKEKLVAGFFTSKKNGRFPRTIVNRYWKKLFGRGLVEPVDDMDAEPVDSALLDWLSADFVEHRYDLKHLLRRIMTSEAYRMQAAAAGKEFRGPLMRRITAEEFADGISAITGEWQVLRPAKAGAGKYARNWRFKTSPLTRALGRPIRDQVYTDRNTDATTLQALELVNGVDFAQFLDRSVRRMLGLLPPSPANLFDSGDVRGETTRVDLDITGLDQVRLLLVDVDSYDPGRVVAGWAEVEFEGAGGEMPASASRFERKPILFRNAKESAEALVVPLGGEIVFDVRGKGYTRLRAVAGVDKTSLASDIGPKVRFFVFGDEPDRRQLVRVEGERPVAPAAQRFTADTLIARLYRHALGRQPSAAEARVALGFFPGGKPEPEGAADLLWSLVALPEFQYVR